MQSHYEKLIVWQESHSLCREVYGLLPQFPTDERFSMCSQIRRSAYSVPMNIVEGNTKRSHKEKLRYLEISEGSLDELDYQLLLSRDLKYISDKQFTEFREKIRKVGYLLNKFRDGVKSKSTVTP